MEGYFKWWIHWKLQMMNYYFYYFSSKCVTQNHVSPLNALLSVRHISPHARSVLFVSAVVVTNWQELQLHSCIAVDSFVAFVALYCVTTCGWLHGTQWCPAGTGINTYYTSSGFHCF